MEETHGCETNNGAGILILCPSTRRLLLGLRSSGGNEPHTWCNFGGGMQTGETPLKTAIRENLEESEIYPFKIIESPLYINQKPDGYRYYTYIGLVNGEVKPAINHEHDDYNWFRLSELANIPLHSEFSKEIHKPEIIQIIQNYLSDVSNKENH